MLGLLRDSLVDLRRRWKPLFLTDLLYKLLALAILTPLVAICLRWFLSISGREVLADVDVLFFLLTPIGLACAISVGALWLAIVALELASLMGVLGSGIGKKSLVLGSLRFASFHAWPVCRVTARIVAKSLIIAAPFLAVAAAVYLTLLTEFDINYYLKTKPPVFQVALGIGGVLVVGLAAALIYATAGWLLALPLVLFEDVRPSEALQLSRERTSGSRWTLVGAITLWALAVSLLSSLLTGSVLWVGRLVVDRSYDSLSFLSLAIGISLVVGALINLIVNLVGTTTFASLLFHSYRKFGNPKQKQITELWHLTADRSAGPRITTLRVLAALVVGVLLAALIGAWIARDVKLDNKVLIIAHRGSSAAAPENTRAAIRLAIQERADFVEIDVQETADGEVVVFHDSDFMKLAGVNRKIWEVHSEELRDLDVGSSFDAKFKDERVPTLAEVLDLCKQRVGVNIELKYYGHTQKLEQRVIDLVESHEMTDDVIFMSLKNEAVKKMKTLRPDWKTGLLLSVSLGDLRNLEADFLAINAKFASRSLIREAHQLGKEVYVWTVNDPVTMAVMMGRGADGVITDKPSLAEYVRRQRAQLNAAERLMLEFAEFFGVTPEIADQ